MTRTDIEKAFKRWGDPNAAKRGMKKTTMKVYGGHGNGGKFYMRQMFKESRFITYKEGLLNIFGFSDNKKYGYAKGYQDKKIAPSDALKFAEIADMPFPQHIKQKVLSGETGFTVVQGIGPEGVKSKFRVTREVDRLKNHPQSHRILLRSNVSVVYNSHSLYGLLKPDELPPLEDFSEPRVIVVPEELKVRHGHEVVAVQMANSKYPPGRLVLRTSSETLNRGSRFGELNRIDILGEIGVIGSYQLIEMGVTSFPHAAFIYGEFGPASDGDTSILEDEANDCVTNDRSKLAVNDMTRALIEWIAGEVDKLANDIAALDKERQKANQKQITSRFNDVLNSWKNKHMSKIMSDIFGGAGTGGGGVDVPPGPRPQEVTLPLDGFDFKYPRAEIQVNNTQQLTLKVCVPETLPIGATIFFSSTNESIQLDVDRVAISSDMLKATPDGREVAFVDVQVTGHKVDASGTVHATAGSHHAQVELMVIAPKESKSGKTFPRVLLSGEVDPLGIAIGGKLTLGEREPVVYQRPQDVAANIYWINTSSPLASRIYDRFTFDSPQWRSYLFDRYVDIFIKEAVHELYRKDYENFNSDAVDQKIAEVVRRVHQSANEDLESFLFDDTFSVPSPQ
jgi:hypothetical protein